MPSCLGGLINMVTQGSTDPEEPEWSAANLQDFLYPEAMQLTGAADCLDLPKCAASLDPRCSSASCRKAALELLAELMGDTPASLEEGVSLLIELHYQHPVLTVSCRSTCKLAGSGQCSQECCAMGPLTKQHWVH
jgi:hypothetical protein